MTVAGRDIAHCLGSGPVLLRLGHLSRLHLIWRSASSTSGLHGLAGPQPSAAPAAGSAIGLARKSSHSMLSEHLFLL